jgi:hypothetical protein
MATNKPADTKSDVPAIPEHLRKYQEQAAQSKEADSLAASGSATIPRVSLKGSKLRYVIGEEESKKSDSIDVVIVGVDPSGGRMMKAYYEAAYDPNNPEPPDCSSTNGIYPDPWVQRPVAEQCMTCPKNAFGTGKNAQGQATRGKACKDSKWLWVVKLEEITEDNPQYYALAIPPMSLKALSAYGRTIKKTGIPLHLIHTRISMDDEQDYPAVLFEMVGFLDEDACEISTGLNHQKPWVELIGDTENVNPHMIGVQDQGRSLPKEQKVPSASDMVDTIVDANDVDAAVDKF